MLFLIVTITGMSGAGKTLTATCLEKLGFKRVVTYTSRNQRDGERDGVDYFFRTYEEIRALHEDGKLLECVTFCGNIYASPLVNAGADWCIVVDSAGARTYKYAYGDECFAVLLTIADEVRMQRLYLRGDANPSAFRVEEPIPNQSDFDITIDSSELSPQEIADLIASKCKKIK